MKPQTKDTLTLLSIIVPILSSYLIYFTSDDFKETEYKFLIIASAILLLLIPIIVSIHIQRLNKKKDQKNQLKIDELEKKEKEKEKELVALKKKQEEDKKIKYADKLPEIIETISAFLNSRSKKDSLDKAMVDMDVLFNKMSLIYKDLKGAECCLTAKSIRSDEESIFTLSRSSGVNFDGRIKREIYTNRYNRFDLFIEANTDLKAIYGTHSHLRMLKYLKFFSNNLIKYHGLNHSLLKDYQDKINLLDDKEKEVKIYELWPLPYKSTIVVPLGLMNKKTAGDGIIKDPKNNNDTDEVIYGTLCIDSNETHVFDENIDTAILQALAETVYLRLRSIYTKVKNTSE